MRRPLILAIVVGTCLTLPLAAQNCTDTVTWTGAVNTDWNTAGNWSPARVPTQSDTATIPLGKTVTNQPGAGLGTGFICSLTLDGTLTIDTSALILLSTTVASTLKNLTLTSAQGTSGLTVRGSASFNGSLMLSPGQVDGTGMATINGTVQVTKGPSFIVTATLNNEGSIAVSQDGVQLTLGTSVFNNDGAIALQGDGITIGGSGAFNNSAFGSITKSRGTGTSSFSPGGVFTDAGAVAAQMGTLNFTATGTSTGVFNATGGATLRFGNIMTLNAGTTIAGGGTADIVAGGVWDLKAPLTVNTAQLTLDGGAGNVIRGDSDVTISSQVTWNGGWLGTSGGSAKATFTKNVTIATTTSHASFRSLDIFATVTMNADLSMNAPNSTTPTITVEKGATFNIGTDNGVHGQCTINNGGTFEKTGGTGVSTLDYSGNFSITTNSDQTDGTVTVNSGTLNLAVLGGGFAGTSTVGQDATLEFSAGNYDLNDGTVIAGSGTTLLTQGGSWIVTSGSTGATISTDIFTFSGLVGSNGIQGIGTLTLKSAVSTWTGGPMQGLSGTTTIPNGHTLDINNGQTGRPLVNGRTINNMGNMRITDATSLALGGGAVLNNQGFFVFSADGNISNNGGGATFNNDGFVEKTATGGGNGTSVIQFSGTLNNNADARVIADSGTLQLSPDIGTSAGEFVAQSSTSTVSFVGSSWTINSGTTMTGNGTIALYSADWALTTNLDVQTTTGFSMAHITHISGAFDLIVESLNISLSGFRHGVLQNNKPVGTLKIPKQASSVTVGNGSFEADACTLDSFSKKFVIKQTGRVVIQDLGVFLDEKGGVVYLAVGPTQGTAIEIASGTFTNFGFVTIAGVQYVQRIAGSIPGTGIFNNFGTVAVPGLAALNISVGGGTSGGTYTVGSNGRLVFQDGDFSVTAATQFTGSGTINLGGTFEIGFPTTVNSTIFRWGPQYSSNGITGGSLQGTANLTITSPSVGCDAGTIAMAPSAAVSFGAGLCTDNVPSPCSIAGGTVNSSCKWELNNSTGGGMCLGGGATLNNEATIDIQDKNSICPGGGTGTLNNQSTLQCTASPAGVCTVDINGPVTNTGSVAVQSGTLAFGASTGATTYTQTTGTTSVSSGATLSDTQPINISGGLIGGAGTISGAINNIGGTLQAGSATGTGILNLSGGETQGANSTFTVVIAGTIPGTQYDQINEANSIVGNGTLKFQFASGFTPAPTNTFDIVNFSSGSGTLKNVITNSPTCKAVLTPTTKALNVKFTSTNVSVMINPPTVTLHENQQQQFTDTVSNGCGNGVTWSVKESGGGTIDQTGLYTAPARTGTFHVVVTSIADPSKFAFSTVTVIAARNQLAVTPPAALLQPGKTLLLRADRSVVWSIAEGKSGGRVNANGRYTAPLKAGLYHVVATSTADPSQHAMANLAVLGGKLNSAYVANIDQDSISALSPDRDATSPGPLRETASVATGQKPAALALSPNGKFLLSANENSNDVSVFALSPSKGKLGAVAGASAGTGTRPGTVAFDPSGRFVFVANRGSDDVSIFSADVSGLLTLLSSHALPAGEAPGAIAVHPQTSLLFVAGTGSNLIHGFTFTDGSLKEIAGSPFDVGTAPAALAVDASGRFLFVANHDSGDISVFSIDTKKEALRQVSGSPFHAGKAPAALALDLTGSYLFVADHDSDDITTFQIDGEAGALTRLGLTPLPTAGPSALAVDPSGQCLYVVSDRSASITALRMDVATGMLTPTGKTLGRGKASSIVLAGSSPEKP